MWPIGMRSFPLGLGGMMEEVDSSFCKVCGLFFIAKQKRIDGVTVYYHTDGDFCVSP